MKCNKCGFENVGDAKFCINCGARLDGKVLCPKCNSYIEPDVKNCPNCGRQIPHRGKDENNAEILSKKERVYQIFRKVISIVSIIFISLILLIFAAKMIFDFSIPNNGHDLGWIVWERWLNLTDLFTYATQSQKTTIIITYALGSLFAVATSSLSIIFSISTLKMSIQSLKTKEYKLQYSKMAGLLLVLIFNTILLNNFGVSFSVFDSKLMMINSLAFSTSYSSFSASLIAIILIIDLVIKAIFKSEKNAGNILERVFSILLFTGVLFLFTSYNNDYMSTFYGIGHERFEIFQYFISIGFYSGDYVINSNTIAWLTLNASQLVLSLCQITCLSFVVIYFVINALGKNYNRKSFRIPVYAASLISTIFSFLMLGIAITDVVLINSSDHQLLSFATTNLSLSLFVLACSITSFSIFRSNARRERLMDQTTKE